ncbi:DUF739 family protein [Anaeromicropila populeti]|uniref:HTH cro/C1-type domain-containing protein n=1 Tax=Anaeromicropila populeti TaxID=37658 RepID=A0A1I6KTZ9_9FIRM|nr:DUF739 family protein [Anaeromicropila populeti]SFR94699.1 Protein of unknown function [Anaeromicropila populeti]
MSSNKQVEFDYSKLRGRIKEYYGTQEKLADALNIGRVSLSQRLNNRIDFLQSEINQMSKLLEIEKFDIPEYFFKVKK